MASQSEPTKDRKWEYIHVKGQDKWGKEVNKFLNEKVKPYDISEIQTAIWKDNIYVWARPSTSSTRYQLKRFDWSDGPSFEGYFRNGNATIAGLTLDSKKYHAWLIQPI